MTVYFLKESFVHEKRDWINKREKLDLFNGLLTCTHSNKYNLISDVTSHMFTFSFTIIYYLYRRWISPYTFFLGKLFLLLEVIVWRKTWCPINFFQPVVTEENLGDLTRNSCNSITNSWQMLLTYSCQIEENR